MNAAPIWALSGCLNTALMVLNMAGNAPIWLIVLNGLAAFMSLVCVYNVSN